MRLLFERSGERVERGQQVALELAERGEMDRGREDIVRALPHVDVVVRVHVLAGQGGDDLVGIHVRARARARLEDVDRELVVVLAARDRIAGCSNPLRLLRVEQSELGIGAGSGGLDAAEPARHGDGNRLTGNLEVDNRFARFASPQLPLDLGAHGAEVYPATRDHRGYSEGLHVAVS